MIKRRVVGDADYDAALAKRMNQCMLCANCTKNCPAGVITEDLIEKNQRDLLRNPWSGSGYGNDS
jgi:succinate dehydrogenase/fumarate reductase-like Fe-S protein